MAEINISNINKSFGSTHVIKDVSLEIKSESFTVFVGPSGCGKSTMLRMIAGLEEVNSGTISIDGQVINDLPPSERNIAMVFQSYALYPHMTVFDNMAFGLEIEKKSKEEITERVMEAAKILQIEEYLERKPKQLSGGQRQRVAIARAIILEPKLILLDEPTSALDVSIQMQILNLLKDLQSRLGLAYLCISHDLKVIRFLSDYVYVMKDGNIVEDGISDDLFESPNHIYTQELLAASIA